ncbi:hypothetical protein ScPMuIL_016748 [Solemya velum]
MSAWLKRQITLNLACPKPGFMGWLTSVLTRSESKLLENQAVQLCGIKKDHHVLELGFGMGYGIQAAYQHVKGGAGMICGVDISQKRYFEATKYFRQKIDEGKIDITYASVYQLPFSSERFDCVFHTDCYYFWYYMDLALEEIHRVMKPGSCMVSTMCLDSLKKASSRGILRYDNCDPLQYMASLEYFGFQDIRIEYHQQGRKKFESITAWKGKAKEDRSIKTVDGIGT